MFAPPSTLIVWPVMKSLSSEAQDDGADEVIRFLVALEGASLSTVLKLLGCQHAFLLRTGDRESRRDRVHANIIGPQFAREGAGEADHARLRSHVVEKERRAAERRAG